MGNSASSSSLPSKLPTVLIIGGGPGGATLARALDATNKFFTILIDRKNYYFHTIGTLRAAILPSFADKVIIPYDNIFDKNHNGVVIQGEVERITADNQVKLAGKDKLLSADIVVIATGSSYSFPNKLSPPTASSLLKSFSQSFNDFSAAKNILIVGAGHVGVELSGEITEFLKGKGVTIVSSTDTILSPAAQTEKLRNGMIEKMKKRGVKFVFNTNFDFRLIEGNSSGNNENPNGDNSTEGKNNGKNLPGGLNYHVIPNGGTEFKISGMEGTKYDIIVDATGTKLNNSTWSDSLAAYVENNETTTRGKNGKLKTNLYLQIEGKKNLYAIGDANSLQPSMAFFAGQQAEYLAKNLYSLYTKEESKDSRTIAPYEPVLFQPMFLPLGTTDGMGQFPNKAQKVVGSFLVKMIKGKDLFAGKTSGSMGIKYEKKGVKEWEEREKGGRDLRDGKWRVVTQKIVKNWGMSEADAEELVRGYEIPVPKEGQLHV